MQYFVGTSGYSYKEWKGSFYPAKFSDKKMLGYYGERFPTVEINYTFRAMPSDAIIQSWALQAPASFRFVCKAPQAITHHKKLNDTAGDTQRFFDALAGLKKRQGPVLFQLPPTFKKDAARLEQFLRSVQGTAVAMEFRHQSWFDDEVFACLKKHSAAMCVSDGDEFPDTDLVPTAKWGYVRLRRENYTDAELKEWIKRFETQGWREMYVFFRHEDVGTGPALAARLYKLLGTEVKPFGEDDSPTLVKE